jgi:hypothetical protein
MSVTKIAGEYNLLIIFLNQDYTEEVLQYNPGSKNGER